MKNLLLILFAFGYTVSQAAVSKVYVAESSENLSTVPVHGTQSWSSYIGTSRLAFAVGYSYKVKIEYTTKAVGIFTSDVSTVTVSNVVVSGNVLTCNLAVSPNAGRGTFFRLFRSLTGSITPVDPISCELVNIGAFYYLDLKDSSNTTFSSINANDPTALGTLIFYRNTASKRLIFAGENLEDAEFKHTSTIYVINGITVTPASLQQVSGNFFTLVMIPSALSTGNGASLRTQFLNKIFDRAADKAYPWVSYKYVRMKPTPAGFNTGSSTSSGNTSGGLTFNTNSTYQNFLGTLIRVQ